jgi:23S rRNA pseudouridine1911/1915/1917 synthase
VAALTFTVGPQAVRLDGFLHDALPGWSRRLVRRLITEGAVRVNGRRAAKGHRLVPGDRVTLPELSATIAPEPEASLPVLHEDGHLVALDKPGGVPGHALDPRQHGTAAAFLVARYPEMRRIGDTLAPGLVHRLDTGTSGVLLAARTPDAYVALRAALRAHAVEKRYFAWVAGDARGLDGAHIVLPLAHAPGDRRRMLAATGRTRSWPAETRVAVLSAGAARSLVEATIRTGVTHQVRVHLALRGHPVLGDTLYGGPDAGLAPGRHALHAARMTLPHPADGRSFTITAAPPADLAALGGD